MNLISKLRKKRLTKQKLANVTNDTATDTNRKTPSAATNSSGLQVVSTSTVKQHQLTIPNSL